MNIDRPLDEIVKESVAAKKAARLAKQKDDPPTRLAKRKDDPPTRKPKAKPAPASAKLGVAKRDGSGPISKNKRRRDRRAAAATAAAAAAAANSDSDRPAPRDKPAPRPSNIAGRLSAPRPKGSGPAAARAPPKGVKIRISNLHPGVTETDIAELFETVGPIKKASLKSFANGHSACEAEVIFERMADALEAINRYNQVPLDNHPLHITLATDSPAQQQDSEPVHARMGKPRGRAVHNGRKPDYPHENGSPDRGNGYHGQRGNSPDDDRQGGPARRQNRRRYNRRYQNKAGNGNGNGNGNPSGGDRDSYD